MNQTAPKFIGKRIRVVREKKALHISISQKVERWQEALLIAWLAAWAFCGLVFVYYLFSAQNNMEKIFLVVITSIWLFFVVRIAKVLMWRLGGNEVITVVPGELIIQNTFWNKGKKQRFALRNVFKLGLINKNPQNFLAFMDDSFWIMGGEKIGFSYSGTKIQLGKQLGVRDSEALLRTLDFAVKEFSKETQS